MAPLSTPALPFQDPQQSLELRVRDLVDRLTLDEKVRMLHQYQPAVSRLGIAPYKHGTEAAHGISWLGQATAFPQPTGLASTWDPALLEEVGRAIGEEARGFYRRDPAKNGLTLWAPTVDLERDPRWGRTEEAYGEDPCLVAETAGALVRGIQGDHPVYLRAAATLKHFLGNNHEADRGTVSVTLDPRNLHEYYHRPFERIFRRSGAVSMMTAYNAVNGIPCNLHPDVLARAKREWGCAFIVSDAGDVVGTNREHKWFPTLAQAVAANIKAGIDSITDDQALCLAAAHEALATGLLTEADVDQAVANALRVRFRLGEFDRAGRNPYEALGEDQIGSAPHRALARKAVVKSIVLLKNTPQGLPLSPADTRSVAVVGPLADTLLRDWYSGEATHVDTPARALARRWPGALVDDTADVVRFRVPGTGPGTGPVAPDAEGRLAAGPSVAPALWRRQDWGWAAHTFQDPATGRYLTTDDRHLRATATEVFGWFTKEVFLVGPAPQGHTALALWNGLPVRANAEGVLEALAPDDLGPGRIGIDGGTAGAAALASVTPLCGPLDLEVTDRGLDRAVAAARQTAAAVVVVGCHPLINSKETLDRTSLDLPPSQVALVKAVAAVNPRTILVVISGYPLALDAVLGDVAAIVHVTHAGPELAEALASVLDGTENPAGRTSLTWYRSSEVLPPLTDYDVMRSGRTYRWFGGQALFPFGHGLSYSRFAYRGLTAQAGADGRWRVSVEVTNTSERPGDEVVQVYATVKGTLPHPRVQLLAFARRWFAPGQTQAVVFDLDPADVAHWDVVTGRWTLDRGQVTLAAGPSSADLPVSASLPLEGPAPVLRDLTAPVPFEGWDEVEAGVIDWSSEGGSAAGFRRAGYLRHRPLTGTGDRPVTFFEVRVSSAEGGEVRWRWGGPAEPVAGTLKVAPGRPGETWRTLRAPVTDLPSSASLWIESTVKAGRNQGLQWFRFGS